MITKDGLRACMHFWTFLDTIAYIIFQPSRWVYIRTWLSADRRLLTSLIGACKERIHIADVLELICSSNEQ